MNKLRKLWFNLTFEQQDGVALILTGLLIAALAFGTHMISDAAFMFTFQSLVIAVVTYHIYRVVQQIILIIMFRTWK